ncbi:unannotated protein [freshwater metagenome]|uniref:Unannotated protein n=1 Tax=freshwater metagenome TaxID=449393 RepID=A0A6J6ATS2_9ZZZZ|nr:hypothetical protein [Actinomycetota bacterium]
MKKKLALPIAALVIASLSFAASASAAQKSISVKKIEKLVATTDAEMLIASGPSIILISNTESPTARISLTALDSTGLPTWQKKIESQQDQMASAATTDTEGNIWLAGFSAPQNAVESATAAVVADNPDGVVPELYPNIRQDLRVLTVWKLSSIGDVISTYSKELTEPGLINAIAVNATGVSVVGQFTDKPFLITANQSGTLSKMYFVGTAKTTINTVVRNSDSSSSLFGSSTEKLGGKTLVGKRDGILMKVSKSGSVTAVVRSSIAKGDRSWLSADSNLLLTGYVKSGKITESAITKFNSSFAPTWTIRIQSSGESVGLSSGKNSIAALSSTSAVKSLVGWKPTKNQLLVVSFDSKGIITGASGSSELSAPVALSYSKELGVVGLAKAADQSVAVFKVPK